MCLIIIILNDLIDEATAAEKKAGIASRHTQLSVILVVDNVQNELDQIEEKHSEQDKNSFNSDMNRPFIALEDERMIGTIKEF